MASDTTTIVKGTRGPRTGVVSTVENMFETRAPSTSSDLSPVMILDNVLKPWMELFKGANDRKIFRIHRV